MMAMNYLHYIVRDSAVCGGEPAIRGTRVPVRTVLASLEDGMSITEIVRELPILDGNAVRAVIAFAAALAEEDLPIRPAPKSGDAAGSAEGCATSGSAHSLPALCTRSPSPARRRP